MRRKRRGPTELLLTRPCVEDPVIAATIREYVMQTVEELGGWGHLSAGQRAMLLSQRITLTVMLAAQRQIVEDGELTGPDSRPSPLLRVLNQYVATFRQGQVALGLARARAPRDNVLTLEEIREEYANRRAKRSEKA
jgi:hypothetical protein